MQQEYCHTLNFEDSATFNIMPQWEESYHSFGHLFEPKEENDWIDQFLLPEAFYQTEEKEEGEHSPSHTQPNSNPLPRE